MTETPQTPEAPTPPAAGGSAPGKGLAITGLILGICGLVLFCFWFIAIPCSVIGLILSILAKNKAKAAGMKSGLATAGLVLCVIALGLDVLGIILIVAGVSFFGSKADEMQRSLESMETSMVLLRSFLA